MRALFGPTVVFVLGGPGAGKGGAKPILWVSINGGTLKGGTHGGFVRKNPIKMDD